MTNEPLPQGPSTLDPRLSSAAQPRKEQPLNVELGKQSADGLFSRRDRSEVVRQLVAAGKPKRPPHPSDELTQWLNENLGGDWISALDCYPV